MNNATIPSLILGGAIVIAGVFLSRPAVVTAQSDQQPDPCAAFYCDEALQLIDDTREFFQESIPYLRESPLIVERGEAVLLAVGGEWVVLASNGKAYETNQPVLDAPHPRRIPAGGFVVLTGNNNLIIAINEKGEVSDPGIRRNRTTLE